MSFVENRATYFVNREAEARGLARESDRKIFLAAIKQYRRYERLCEAIIRPARFEEAKKLAKDLGVFPDKSTAEQIFELQLEDARAKYAREIHARAVIELVEATSKPLFALHQKHIARVEEETEKVAKAEKAAYERWAIPYERSLLLDSMRATVEEMKRQGEMTAHGYPGDDPAKFFGFYFDGQPLVEE